jgi:hypothetical protein
MLGMTERQIQYYRQAAELLGILRRIQGQWRLTEAGQALLLSDSSETMMAGRIVQLPIMQTVIRATAKTHSREKRLEIVSDLLRRSTVLGDSTCLRRARTLLAWLEWSCPRIANSRVSKGLIFPAAEESQDALIPEDL